MRSIALALGLALVVTSGSPAAAQLVEDFDTDFGAWEPRPSFIGTGGTPGWRVVSNAGERAARTSPTGTQATYYWRLEQDFDLTGATAATLTVKYDYRGHTYDHFRVLVGPEGATRLSQYTVVHDVQQPTVNTNTVSLDLAAWAGTRVRVRLHLRKPSGVVEGRIGLYVHRIELDATMSTAAPPPTDLRIGAFNAWILGVSKLAKADVVPVLVNILRRYDLVLVQEIRDASDTTDEAVLALLNAADGGGWGLRTSARLGRTTSNTREQYAYYYRTARLQPLDTLQIDDGVDDGSDVYEREPYAARFSVVGSSFDVGGVGLHA